MRHSERWTWVGRGAKKPRANADTFYEHVVVSALVVQADPSPAPVAQILAQDDAFAGRWAPVHGVVRRLRRGLSLSIPYASTSILIFSLAVICSKLSLAVRSYIPRKWCKNKISAF